ncbi:unnamed protein product, partial [Prorocentrum cordatum]
AAAAVAGAGSAAAAAGEPAEAAAAAGPAAASGAEEKAPPPARKERFPSLLAELGLRATPRGLLLPEWRKAFLQRRRAEREQAALAGEPAGQLAVKDPSARTSRKPSGGQRVAPLDEVSSALFHAALNGSSEDCVDVLNAGADINVRSNADMDGLGKGATALHVATSRGHEDAVATLLQRRADPTLTTGRNEAPVQIAARLGHVGIVRLLRVVGAAPADAESALQLLSTAPAHDDRKRRRMHAALDPYGRDGGRPPQRAPPPPAIADGDGRGGEWDAPEAAHPSASDGCGARDGKSRGRGKDGKGKEGKGKDGKGGHGKDSKKPRARTRARGDKGAGKGSADG